MTHRALNDLQYEYFYNAVEGGGIGSNSVTVDNFPTTQAVTGPVTNAQLTAVTGAASAAAWDGNATSATMIAILKAIHAQLVIIATNTTST